MSIIKRPIIVLPYECPGCLDRIVGFLTFWLLRLLFASGFFALGYGCSALVRGCE
jgi:hypothetical protein